MPDGCALSSAASRHRSGPSLLPAAPAENGPACAGVAAGQARHPTRAAWAGNSADERTVSGPRPVVPAAAETNGGMPNISRRPSRGTPSTRLGCDRREGARQRSVANDLYAWGCLCPGRTAARRVPVTVRARRRGSTRHQGTGHDPAGCLGTSRGGSPGRHCPLVSDVERPHLQPFQMRPFHC